MKNALRLSLIGFMAMSGCQKSPTGHIQGFSSCRPLSILTCRRSIDPAERTVLSSQVIPEKFSAFLDELGNNARKTRAAYVCCEYYVQNSEGETVGILTDNRMRIVRGLDIGRHRDAMNIHSKTVRDILLLDDERICREAFSFLIEMLGKSESISRRFPLHQCSETAAPNNHGTAVDVSQSSTDGTIRITEEQS